MFILNLKYLAFQTPAPRDSENLLSKVDQQEKEENARLVEYLKGVAKLIEGLKAEVTCLFTRLCYFWYSQLI
jgi:hypothetical protein